MSKCSYLEAFRENGLYCERGIADMKQYMTVKEVCQMTGLTRKHLYYFHHENVVRATAHANYSVEGNDGYKLYDQQAVEKLQWIALYYRLGLKRNEIRDMMLASKLDSYAILNTLLAREHQRLLQIKQNIELIKHLISASSNGALSPDAVEFALRHFTHETR